MAHAFGKRGSKKYELNQAVTTLFTRHAGHYPCSLTVDEYMALVLSPEQAAHVKAAAKLVIASATFYGQTPLAWPGSPEGVKLIPVLGAKVPLRPQSAVVLPDANPEVIARIETWLVSRIKIGQDYARVKRVLDMLDDACTTVAQVRYLWPGFLILCANGTQQLKELGAQHNEYKVPSIVPALPVGLREACKRTGSTLAAAQLLPEPEARTVDVTLGCSSVSFTEPDLGTMRSL